MKLARLSPLLPLLFCLPLYADRNQPEVVRMTVRPAAAPQPALKYHLLPGTTKQTEGNAAEAYLLAFSAMPAPWGREMDDVFQVPLDQLKARFGVEEKTALTQGLDLAARRNYCHWSLPLREQGAALLLPYLNPARDAANRVALAARIQIAAGRYDDAVHSLQTGLAMSRHLAEPPLLVTTLVSAGIADTMLDRVAELEQAKDGPNLYWALADLPRPMFDPRHATGGERAMPFFSLPGLRDRHPEELSEQESRAVLEQLTPSTGVDRIKLTTFLIQGYAEAKHELADRGLSPQRIEQMPTSTVLVAYLVDQYEREADNLYKWQGLPYARAAAGVSGAEDAFSRSPTAQANPLFRYVPSLENADYAMAAIDRKVAMLQCVEAIRAYAAAHDGKPPAFLDELHDTPVPSDPVLGKPFGYEVNGNTVTLRGGRPLQGAGNREKVYIVTLSR